MKCVFKILSTLKESISQAVNKALEVLPDHNFEEEAPFKFTEGTQTPSFASISPTISLPPQSKSLPSSNFSTSKPPLPPTTTYINRSPSMERKYSPPPISPTLFSNDKENTPVTIPSYTSSIPGYIIALQETKLIIVNIPAGKRTIFSQQVKAQRISKEIQHLLIPMPFQVNKEDGQELTQNLDNFKELGITITQSNNSFVVEAVLACLQDFDIKQVILEVLEKLKEEKTAPTQNYLENSLNQRLLSQFNKASSKTFEREEGQIFLNQLFKTPCPQFCPKGKKIFVELTSSQIELLFDKNTLRSNP